MKKKMLTLYEHWRRDREEMMKKVKSSHESRRRKYESARNRVRVMWEDGLSGRMISRILGIPRPTVYHWVREFGREKITLDKSVTSDYTMSGHEGCKESPSIIHTPSSSEEVEGQSEGTNE